MSFSTSMSKVVISRDPRITQFESWPQSAHSSLVRQLGVMFLSLWLSATDAAAQTNDPGPSEPPCLDLTQALDDPRLRWSGDWNCETNVTHDGVDAAATRPLRSGIFPATAVLSTKVVGPGMLSFWWRVTAASDIGLGADFGLALMINGKVQSVVSEEQFRLSGPDHWVQVLVAVEPGDRQVDWRLSTRGGCTDPAVGTAWVDEVAFNSTRPRITRLLPLPLNDGWHLECQAEPGKRVFLQRSVDLVSWEDVFGPSDLLPATGCIEFEAPKGSATQAYFRLRVVEQ